MIDPLFWLGLSLLLVAISLTAVLVAALPAFLELARAARSAEKLFDTLRREFPPTLEAIRLTGLEISELADDINEGVNGASGVVKKVDQSLSDVRDKAQSVEVKTRSVVAGVQAAWQTLNRPSPSPRSPLKNSNHSNNSNRLPPPSEPPLPFAQTQEPFPPPETLLPEHRNPQAENQPSPEKD